MYEYLVFRNPNGHAGYEPPTHPNPNGAGILKTVQNIGRSLKGKWQVPKYGQVWYRWQASGLDNNPWKFELDPTSLA